MTEAILFRTRLETFAQDPREINGPWGLKNLLTHMTPENLNPETLRDLTVASSIDVPSIVRTTLSGPFIVDPIKGTTMQAFTDEATVVVFKTGLPVGFYEMADGQIHRDHGAKEWNNTLLPFAARKGSRRWHLEAMGYPDGIRSLANNRYLREIGPEGIGVFVGDTAVHLTDDLFIIGVSGAQMTEGFLGFLMGGNVKEHTLELFAGIGDVILAEGVAERLRNPKLTASMIHPDVLQLPIWH